MTEPSEPEQPLTSYLDLSRAINSKPQKDVPRYLVKSDQQRWINIRWVRQNEGSPLPHTGWKFHISAPFEDLMVKVAQCAMKHHIPSMKFADTQSLRQDLRTLDELRDAQLTPSISPDPLANEDYLVRTRAGLNAVIYYDQIGTDGKPIDWANFLLEIDKMLRVKDIQGNEYDLQGIPIFGDEPVEGCGGVYYRNARSPEGFEGSTVNGVLVKEYMAAHDVKPWCDEQARAGTTCKRYNPSGAEDVIAPIIKDFLYRRAQERVRPSTTFQGLCPDRW